MQAYDTKNVLFVQSNITMNTAKIAYQITLHICYVSERDTILLFMKK